MLPGNASQRNVAFAQMDWSARVKGRGQEGEEGRGRSDARTDCYDSGGFFLGACLFALFAVSEFHVDLAVVEFAYVPTAAACATDTLVSCCPARAIVLETAARPARQRILL